MGEREGSEIESALGSIGTSAVLIFGATLLSQGIGFLTRVTMARYLPVDGYGNVVIGISVLSLFGIVSLVGLPAAVARFLPRKETVTERRAILTSAMQITGVLSVIVASGIFVGAEVVATRFFGNAELIGVIRIFAVILPFYTLFKLSLGGFRGYEQTYPRIITQNVLRPGLQLAGIVLFVRLGYGTTGIAFAYAMAFGAVAVVGVAFLYREGELPLRGLTRLGSVGQYRELLAFSVPLAATSAIDVIAKQSDLIILGLIKSSTEVGLYEVAFRTAIFVPLLFTPAVGYLFQPIISRFDANSKQQRMDTLYTVATRWILVATFPVFALFFLFPSQTLVFFFDKGYRGGQVPLQILLIGFIITLLPGLTSMFLTAVGETKILMYISAGTTILNIGINVALIPTYGMVGAAIATATARTFNNTVQSYVIYRKYGVHPFGREYVVPTALMGAIFVLFAVGPIPFGQLSFPAGVLIATGIGLVYLLLVCLTRSIFAVELTLLDALFERIGVPITISKYLDPFVR